MSLSKSQYLIIGGLRQDYCITHDGQLFLGVLGGNAVYSGVGASLWSDSVGLISRVGSDFPLEWIDQLANRGFNLEGLIQLAEPYNTCTFYAYLSPEERVDTDPASHFLRINQPLPKPLIGYRSSTDGQDSRERFNPLAIRPDDLPTTAADAKGLHLAPADYLTHATVPFRLKELNVPVVTLDPSERYMDPSFDDELPMIVRGLNAFLPSEKDAITFFQTKKMDIWEIAETFGGMGCRHVVIKQGARGQCLWDHESKRRWRIPAYPAKVYDVTGAGDSFCGGFLVGLEQTGDPVEAALRGSISASFTIEGTGALYALDSLPSLVQARLDALRSSVVRV